MFIQVDVFGSLLEDVRCGRLNHASFAGVVADEESMVKLLDTVDESKCIREIDLSRCTFGEKGVRRFCDFLSSKDCCLEKLVLDGCWLDEKDSRLLWESIKVNKSLKNLTILSPGSWSCVADALKENCTLSHLDVVGCRLIQSDMKGFADSLCLNQSLTFLSIDKILADDEAELLAQSLKANHSLQTLSTMFNFTRNGALSIRNALDSNATIKKLDVSNSFMGFEGAKEVCMCLKTNKCISEFQFNNNDLGRGNSLVLCDALKENSSVIILGIGFNYLGPEDGLAIADMLKINRTLTNLNVCTNELGTEGMLAIGASLQKNQVLRILDANSVSADIGQFLGTVLLHNKSLTEINLSDNDVEPDADRMIGEGLKVNDTLRKLFLNDVLIREVEVMSDAIKVNHSLNELMFRNYGFGIEGIGPLCEAIAVNTSITKLSMSSDRLGPDGCVEVAKMLKVNKVLKQLLLSESPAGSEGISAVLEVLLHSNDTLESLSLCNCEFDSSCNTLLCSLIEKRNNLCTLDLSHNTTGSIAESLAKSPSLSSVLISGIDLDQLFDALLKNRNLDIEGSYDPLIKALELRNKFLRQKRLESSLLTLIAIRRRNKVFPKEIFVMIATYMMKTKQDTNIWRA